MAQRVNADSLDPIELGNSLAHATGAYFLYLDSLSYPWDPFGLFSHTQAMRRQSVGSGIRSRYLERTQYRYFNLHEASENIPNSHYTVGANKAAYGLTGPKELRFQIPTPPLQCKMEVATLTIGTAYSAETRRSSASCHRVQWQYAEHLTDFPGNKAGAPSYLGAEKVECHLFTGSTGHRRSDRLFAESIMGYVYVSTNSDGALKSIVVCFRGSQSSQHIGSTIFSAVKGRSGNPDWVTDLNGDMVPIFTHSIPAGMPTEDQEFWQAWISGRHLESQGRLLPNYQVHEGFRQALFSCLPALRKIFINLQTRFQEVGDLRPFLLCTGHSLGAAIAQVFWYCIQDESFWNRFSSESVARNPEIYRSLQDGARNSEVIPPKLITFASPKLWKRTPQFREKIFSNIFTVAVKGDIVVNLSSAGRQFYLPGTKFLILPKFKLDDRDRGFGQGEDDPHAPMSLIESLCHPVGIQNMQLQFMSGEKLVQIPHVYDERVFPYLQAFFPAGTSDFLSVGPSGQLNMIPYNIQTRCFYWHIYKDPVRQLPSMTLITLRPGTLRPSSYLNYYKQAIIKQNNIHELVELIIGYLNWHGWSPLREDFEKCLSKNIEGIGVNPWKQTDTERVPDEMAAGQAGYYQYLFIKKYIFELSISFRKDILKNFGLIFAILDFGYSYFGPVNV